MTLPLSIVNADPEPNDTEAAFTYLRLQVVDPDYPSPGAGPDPSSCDVRVFRAQPVAGAAFNGSAVVLTFASPHGLAPQPITSESIASAPLGAAPTQVTTSAPHGLLTGQYAVVSGLLGNAAINGTWPVTRTGASSFTVPVAGDTVYQGAGTVTGPVGQRVPVLIANVVGFGVGLNTAWQATILDAHTISVPFTPPAGVPGTWTAGGSVSPIPLFDLSGVTGLAVNPVVLTFDTPHGLGPTGAPAAVYVSDVGGNDAADGDWTATVASPTQINIPATGTAAWSGGGKVMVGTGSSSLALHAGAVQAGWSGTSGLLPLDHGTLRVLLLASTPFLSHAQHSVRVLANVVGAGIPPLATLYSFATEDVLAPAVLSAVAQDSMTVQVSFYEPVLQADADGFTDALNPANWSLAPPTTVATGLPAVTPTVASVATGYTPNVVLLTLDVPMTRAAQYTVAVRNVEDLLGNVVDAPTNTALFTGWQSVVVGRDFSVWKFWPVSNQLDDAATHDLYNLLACFQEVLDTLLGEIDGILDITDPDVAPPAWLPSMLADQGNPFGPLLGSLSANDQRRLVHALVAIYSLKGTDAGVIEALNFFFNIRATISYGAVGGPPLGGWFLGTGDSARSQLAEPFTLADGETLEFTLNGGGPTNASGVVVPYRVTLSASDFADITNATAAEVASVLYAFFLANNIGATAQAVTASVGAAVASGSDGVDITSFAGGSLYVGSTEGLAPSGTASLPAQGGAVVSYAGVTPTALTGVYLVSGTGTLHTGDQVVTVRTFVSVTAPNDTIAYTGGTAIAAIGFEGEGSFQLGSSLPLERLSFFVNVPAGLTAQQTTHGEAIVAYMKRAGTRPVWRPPQPPPPAMFPPIGEFVLGPGGSWVLG